MKKPRIIIADTDHEYTLTLQLKFAQEYFEVVEIEIITDRNYFEQLFRTPQSAEILIVSDDLYDNSIVRHNISNIGRSLEFVNLNNLFVFPIYQHQHTANKGIILVQFPIWRDKELGYFHSIQSYHGI